MGKLTRFVLITVAVLVLLVVLAGFALPVFLNADSFRTRIEASLTRSLGRQVTMSKLALSVWSGGLLAQNVQIADDPAFSSTPFLQADSVKIGVELLPLILHKQVRIESFTLLDPKVDLLRGAGGKWNYSTLGKTAGQPAPASGSSGDSLSSLTAGRIIITNGSITVGEQGSGAATAQDRTYSRVNLDIKNFGATSSFPFTLSAALPGDGTIEAKGTAGPINERDSADTPFSIHLEARHIDPLAAGLVDASTGITGLVDSFTLDGAWTGTQLHIAKLLVGSPHLTLVQQSKPKIAATPAASKTNYLQSLTVDDAEIHNGSLTMTTAGKAGAPVVYQQIDGRLSGLTPTTASPFTLSAQLPGGGSVAAHGKAGPFNQANTAATPVNAQASLKGIHIGSAGVLPPDAGIEGTMDMQAQIQSDGRTLQANGNAHVTGLALARNATPSPKPLDVQFAVTKDELANQGQIQHAVLSTGGVALTVAGTFQSTGPSTALNLRVNGNAIPIDAIEAFLPALGVHLPENSQLRGGTLTTDLGVTGSTASPAIAGPVRLDNTQLAGFDLGAKLATLSRLTGGRITSATGSGTNVKLLSMDVQEQGGNIRTDKVDLDVAGVGTATGNGTVSAGGALHYSMLLKLTELSGSAQPAAAAQPSTAKNDGGLGALAGGLAGLIGGGGAGAALGGTGALAGLVLSKGIPVEIDGTTSHPTFAPNLAGLTRDLGVGAVKQVLTGKQGATNGAKQQSNPLKNALGGLLGH